MNSSLRRILVCRTDAIGDAILTLPVCLALKQQLPQSEITFMVSDYTYDLFVNQKHYDKLIKYNPGKTNAIFRQQLKKENYDAVIMVYPDRRLSWIMWRIGIPIRIGTSRRWWSFLYNKKVNLSRKKVQKHEAAYNLDLLAPLALTTTLRVPEFSVEEQDRKVIDQLLEKYRIKKEEKIILVHTGGRGSSANWTDKTYGEFVGKLGNQVNKKIILTGSESEHSKMDNVKKISLDHQKDHSIDNTILLKENMTLAIFKALIARAAILICGNTGPMHIAAAVKTPVIAIFSANGVTGPKRWGPLTDQATIFTAKDLGDQTDNGFTREHIDPDIVIKRVLEIIN